MSITAYKIEVVGHDRTGEDYGYVNIMYRYGNKQSCPRPDQCEKIEVMWADESVYGPPAPGSKVGDFIQTWLIGSWDCGVFTHREIAQRLMDTFTGLKLKELAWFENPTIQFVLEPDSLRKRVRVRFLFIGGSAEGLLGTVNEQRQGITMIVVSCLLLCGIKFALCELDRHLYGALRAIAAYVRTGSLYTSGKM